METAVTDPYTPDDWDNFFWVALPALARRPLVNQKMWRVLGFAIGACDLETGKIGWSHAAIAEELNIKGVENISNALRMLTRIHVLRREGERPKVTYYINPTVDLKPLG